MKDIMKSEEKNRFTWIPFYTELAEKLLEYKNNRADLISFIFSKDGLLDFSNYLHLQDKTQKINDIDPFSFMGIFNRGSLSQNNRIIILDKIKKQFEIKAEVPSDFDGVPVLNYARMFFYDWGALKESCNSLWDAYDAMMNEDLKPWFDYYNITKRKAECTIPLFWCKANDYIALDSRNVDYLKKNGVDVDVNDDTSYLSLLQLIKGKIASREIEEKTFAEISCNAFNQKKAIQYWLYAPGDNATYWDEFYNLGIMAIGWDEIGDLSEFGKKTDIKKKMIEVYGAKDGSKAYMNYVQCTWDFVKGINIGDVVFVKQGLYKVVGYGVVTSDYYFDDNRDGFCNIRTVDWKQKGVWDHPGQAVQKTLTDITQFTDYVEKLKLLFMDTNIKQFTNILHVKKNIILQGAPGTGKTYNTAALALSICSETILETHEEVMKRYEELQKEGRICFCTFHQSMDYEDFVEGIKPKMVNEQVTYEIESGIFKTMCENARSIITEKKSDKIDFSKTRVFKMSLGEKGKDDAEIFDYCLENNVVGLGWGEDKDFSQCKTREDFKALDETWGAFAMEVFKQWMQIGDIILISDGTKFVKAIARIIGDYEFRKDAPINMCQFRKVEWLYTGDLIPISKLYDKNLSQQSIYAFYFTPRYGRPDFNGTIKVDVINEIITGKVDDETPQNYVLIIDEINRGNVSKIFGELITLLEADKRIGGDHPIKVTLPYSKESFGVPSNLYIIGTMNTTDRSVGNIDYAVRRRFAFVTLKADRQILVSKYGEVSKQVQLFDAVFAFLNDEKKHPDMDIDDLMVGHSYFMADNDNELRLKLEYEIIPLIWEYCKDGIINVKKDELKKAFDDWKAAI